MEKSDEPPVAMFGEADSFEQAQTKLTGVTHWYVEPIVTGKPGPNQVNETGRNYSMHFIKFDGLKPATRYTYKVKSPTGGWSDEYTFRSLRPYPETKIAMYLLRGICIHHQIPIFHLMLCVSYAYIFLGVGTVIWASPSTTMWITC